MLSSYILGHADEFWFWSVQMISLTEKENAYTYMQPKFCWPSQILAFDRWFSVLCTWFPPRIRSESLWVSHNQHTVEDIPGASRNTRTYVLLLFQAGIWKKKWRTDYGVKKKLFFPWFIIPESKKAWKMFILKISPFPPPPYLPPSFPLFLSPSFSFLSYITSRSQFPLHPLPHPLLFLATLSTRFTHSVFPQRRAGLPGTSTKHGVTSYNMTKHILWHQGWTRQPSRKRSAP